MNAAEHPEHENMSVCIFILKICLPLSIYICLNISVQFSIKTVLHKVILMCICRIEAVENNPNQCIILNYTLLHK